MDGMITRTCLIEGHYYKYREGSGWENVYGRPVTPEFGMACETAAAIKEAKELAARHDKILRDAMERVR